MFRIEPTIDSEMDVASGSDAILCSVPVPPGGVLKGIDFNIRAMGPEINTLLAIGWGISFGFLPIQDPDTSWTPKTVWDSLMQKDETLAANVIDFDTTGTDTSPAIEWGDPSVEMVTGLSTHGTFLYRNRRLITFADNKSGFMPDGVSAGVHSFNPTDAVRRRIFRPIKATVPSVVMCAISSPVFVTGGFFSPASTKKWMQMTYLQDTLEDAHKSLMGGTEPGAESPYEDAVATISSWLEQLVEEDTDAFAPVALRLFGQFKFEIDVPGSFRATKLVSGD